MFRKIILDNMKRWSLIVNKSTANSSEVWANSREFRYQFS